jgi:anthranilate synthase component 1
VFEIEIRPIAGTRQRGVDEAEDDHLADDLLKDEKERAEHLMLVDLGRNDVGRAAVLDSVRVKEFMVVEYYSHVMHIVSNVECTLKEGMSAIDVLKATFPAGTLSGAPKVRAMEIIDEVEPLKRNIYSGAIGYLSWHGCMGMAIAIRTAVIKNEVLYVQAGAGIVHDSVPQSEWDETMHKARALIKAAQSVN